MYHFKKLCKEPEKIENYEKALADDFTGWHCHHRLQTWTSDGKRRLVDIKAEELKALEMYYNRPASELIFLTNSEHASLHQKGKSRSSETKRKISEAKKGKPRSEDTRRKISESHKGIQAGEKNPMYGKKHSEEAKKKMSEAKKGKPQTEEHKNKLSEVRKGKRWYNNGNVNIKVKECPDGFVPGKLSRK